MPFLGRTLGRGPTKTFHNSNTGPPGEPGDKGYNGMTGIHGATGDRVSEKMCKVQEE